MPDGTFAPSMVIQKTAARIASISGKPSQRFVSSRSSVRSTSNPALRNPRACARAAMSCAAP